MKVKELREKTNEELISMITTSKKELFDLRMKHSTGSLEKPAKLNILKKDVARMKTILKEKEMEASK